MESPNPLPSVLLAESPRINRSVNSSGRIFICCTFGLFTDGLKAFDAAYEQGYFDKVVTTDLTYLPPELYTRPYFIEADMSKFIASLIDFMNHDASLSNTMATTEKMHSILEAYNNRQNIDITMD